jgi:hypothetical protein
MLASYRLESLDEEPSILLTSEEQTAGFDAAPRKRKKRLNGLGAQVPDRSSA